MTILENIKNDQLIARKTKNSLVSSLLTTLIGEAEMIGKNANRDVTEQEVIAIIKKFINNIDVTKKALKEQSNKFFQEELLTILAVLDKERTVLNTFLPIQLSTEQLKLEIEKIKLETGSASIDCLGVMMKMLKERHQGLYDGKLASTLIKEILS